MNGTIIVSRPIIGESSGSLAIKMPEEGEIISYKLDKNTDLRIDIDDPGVRFCTGWYDIRTHTNHSCETASMVDSKYESCYKCRTKTGFNPGFYNTSEISDVQKEYNNRPHSVYVACFGEGLVKAGIMSDSRGLERIYEQGAPLYTVVGKFKNAKEARALEARLISKGLKNSITKKQKEAAYLNPFQAEKSQSQVLRVLKQINLSSDPKIINNMDMFFFGNYPSDIITPTDKYPVSGKIVGQIGRYLVLKNKDRLYGSWLDKLNGYRVSVDNKVEAIDSEPLQTSML